MSDDVVKKFNELLGDDYDWKQAAPESRAMAIQFLNDAKKETTETEWDHIALNTCLKLGLTKGDLPVLFKKNEQQLIMHFGIPKLKTSNWVDTYLQYTEGHEAPELFHYWSAITVLGAVTARKVYFDQHYYKLFPNMYVTLVAPAGRCRRSVATDIAVRMLRKAGGISILAEKGTPEGLLQMLQSESLDERSPLFIHAPELAVFLGKQQYNEGLIALLTTLYNCADSVDFVTRTQPKLNIANVFVAMLAATAPDWLADSIPAIASSGGFMSRNLVIALDDTDRSVPFPTPSDASLQESLTNDLAAIGERSGGFMISDNAKKWYVDWYGKAKSGGPHPLLSGFQERKSDHLIRMAMILTLAQKRELILEEDVFLEALRKLNDIEKNLPSVLSHVGANASAQVQEQVLSFIKFKNGKVTHTELMRNFVGRHNNRTILEALAMLRVSKMVDTDDNAESYYITNDG